MFLFSKPPIAELNAPEWYDGKISVYEDKIIIKKLCCSGAKGMESRFFAGMIILVFFYLFSLFQRHLRCGCCSLHLTRTCTQAPIGKTIKHKS